MSRMIPPIISPSVKSNAERKIFDWFHNIAGTDDWIVLHSLGLAEHQTLIYGEIDFLVLAPQLGIFALEVKGGRVSRKDGKWYFTDRYGNSSIRNKSPFEQSSDGIYSVMTSVHKKYGENHRLSCLLYGSGVMFPDIIFDSYITEAEKWQIFDREDNENVNDFIKRLSVNYRKKWEHTYGFFPEHKIPTGKDVRELADILRGDFDKIVPLSIQIRNSETELIELTKEQLKCLGQLEDNPRCLIHGAAGTGKTLLAIEAVKRAVINGEKVALFCYNTLLANWIKEYFSVSDPEIRPVFSGTFHSFMLQTVRDSGNKIKIPDFNSPVFWQKELPKIAAESAKKMSRTFDRIIIDECQDLINEEYIEFADSILLKGFERGKWNIFGDFSRQAIYSEFSEEEMRDLLELHTSFASFRLRINCRNTKNISEEIKYVTGCDYSEHLRTEYNGPPVDYLTWNNRKEAKEKLEDYLSKLANDGIAGSDITILSPFRREESVISEFLNNIPDYSPAGNKSVTFCTIQSFKGLENSVIILIDINDYENDKLLYTGLSRARSLLTIFESEKAHRKRISLLLKRG